MVWVKKGPFSLENVPANCSVVKARALRADLLDSDPGSPQNPLGARPVTSGPKVPCHSPPQWLVIVSTPWRCLCVFLLMVQSFTEVRFTSPEVNHCQVNHSGASSALPGLGPPSGV